MTGVEPGTAPEPGDSAGTTGAAAPAAASRGRGAALRAALPGLLYPLEIPVVYIVVLAFAVGVSPYVVFRSLVVAVVGVVLVMLAFTAIFRSVHRAAFAMLLVFVQIVCGTVIAVLALTELLLVSILLRRHSNRRVSLASVSSKLSTVTTVLLAIVLIQGWMTGALGNAIADLNQGGGLETAAVASADPADPDIYVIILDGYARADTLLNSFGFDDGPFLNQLKSRGFEVATDSHSNYPMTAQTLVTMLNMAYEEEIPAIADLHTGDPAGNGEFREAINHNEVFGLMKGRGYQIVATGSGWEQGAIRQTDVYLDGGQVNTFEARLLSGTSLGKLIQWIAPDWAADQARSRTDRTFAELRQIASAPSSAPRLVISHVFAPHPPLVYGPNGEHLQIDASAIYTFDWTHARANEAARNAYAGQVAYVNQQVLPVVDAIIAAASRPAVVVLMSDHGSRMDGEVGSLQLSPEANNNFFATLTPGHQGLFGESPTPVNVFPQILNAYLGTDLPIRPDLTFTSLWGNPLNVTPLSTGTAP